MALITIVNGVYKPTYNWGAPHCMVHGSSPTGSLGTSLLKVFFKEKCPDSQPQLLQLFQTWWDAKADVCWRCWSIDWPIGCAWKISTFVYTLLKRTVALCPVFRLRWMVKNDKNAVGKWDRHWTRWFSAFNWFLVLRLGRHVCRPRLSKEPWWLTHPMTKRDGGFMWFWCWNMVKA